MKRAVAEGLAAQDAAHDAAQTVSLDVAAVKRAQVEAAALGASAGASEDEDRPADSKLADADADAELADSEHADSEAADGELAEYASIESAVSEPTASEADASETETSVVSAAPETEISAVESAASFDTESDPDTDSHPGADFDAGPGPGAESDSDADSGFDSDPSVASADLVPAADNTIAPSPYLASTALSDPAASGVVAVPETADDVIATIHAAATVVAAADRRAREAVVAKEDPWTGLDLHRLAAPAPVGNVLDLLAPVLERPILVVDQPGLPAPADVVALHRSELELDFVEPPVVAAGAEPPIPPRFGPGLSVLPHIEFPV